MFFIKKITTAAAFLFLSCNAFAFEPTVNSWNNFEGKIGNANVVFSLFLQNATDVKGNYFYTKQAQKIRLEGKIKGDSVLLTEYVNNKPNGYFAGKFFTTKIDGIEGKWYNAAKDKSFDFNFTLNSICSGKYDKRYPDLFGADDELESFVKKAKQAILSGDKKWVAAHVRYPVKTQVKAKQVSIKNSAQLVSNFDAIFTTDFKNKLKPLPAMNLFNNYQGAMIGNGEMWFSNTLNSTAGKYDFSIIAINN